MGSAFAACLTFLSLLTLVIVFTTATTINTKLIHRGSIISRKYLAKDEFRDVVFQNDARSLFLVNLSIGEPPVPQLLVPDTGSSLSWVMSVFCLGCDQKLFPLFNYTESSTYESLSCESNYCIEVIHDTCDSPRQCRFSVEYVLGSAEGIVGTETLTFETYDKEITSVSSVTLGFADDYSGRSDREMAGILGLGYDQVSLLHSMSSKFSYCIGNISDPQYPYNHLILGDEAILEGYSTPIEVYGGHYYLTLEGIRVGDYLLYIEPVTFHRSSFGRGGVVIDSGATYSSLTRRAFEPLKTRVMNLLGEVFKLVEGNDDDICYEGNVYRDLKGFPEVTFHFAEGANLVLGIESFFSQDNDEEFCMAVRPSDELNLGMLSIIRATAQQYYNFGYDLVQMRLYFMGIDCQLLGD